MRKSLIEGEQPVELELAHTVIKTQKPKSIKQLRLFGGALWVMLSSTLAGLACGPNKPAANLPTDDGTNSPRDVAMKHEECDLSSEERRVADADLDGHPDIISVFESGREVCRAIDINMDKTIDVYAYYDPQGRVRRRESGFDRDNRPDEIGIYQNGILVLKMRETNNDAKIDTWDYFVNGQLVREERDSTGDGFVDQWWSFNRPGQPRCAVVMSDNNGDGRPDADSKIDLCAGQAPPPPVGGTRPALPASPAAPAKATKKPAASPAPTGAPSPAVEKPEKAAGTPSKEP